MVSIGLRFSSRAPAVAGLSSVGLVLASTMAMAGCSSEAAPSDTSLPAQVTWYSHIRPLVTEKCNGCHQAGGIGPFSTESYEDARKWSAKMNRDIQSGAMPPWSASDSTECVHPAPFKDDLRLSDQQKALFQKWVDDGTPAGDPTSAAELPALADLKLANPSSSLTIPAAVDVSGSTDQFKCFPLDPGFQEDQWVSGVQVTAGNPSIVHHVLVYTDKEGAGAELAGPDGIYDCFGGPGISSPSLLGAWAPGAVPAVTPDGMAMRLRTGTKLVIQVHYHPTGSDVERDDSTRVDLRASTKKPLYAGALFLIGNFPGRTGQGFGLLPGKGDPTSVPQFLIPANEESHVETQLFQVPGDDGFQLRLWAVGTHMHWAGKDMLVTVQRPTGNECLIHTPTYDFNWQRLYFFDGSYDNFPTVRAGDIVRLRCTYDDTLKNSALRNVLESEGLDAPVDIELGEETTDEMCLGVFGAALPVEYADALDP